MFQLLKKFSFSSRNKKISKSGSTLDEVTTVPSSISQAKIDKDKGNVFLSAGDLENAEIWYRQSIVSDANYAEAYNNLGFVLKEQGRLAEAEQYLELAISINPGLGNAYYNM